MTSDSAEPSVSTASPSDKAVDCQIQVRLKREGEQLQLILPKSAEMPDEATWLELWQQLKHRLNTGERFWQESTIVHLIADDQLLDGQKLQVLADALSEVDLKLQRVFTSRRQTAIAAVTAGY
ncbi:MAG: septum site-determining protein MinC, partial [Symploca sp. SIO2D2]|nr:septum site-determining protein MinC [Symploca sp. SIO2D2]